MDFTLSMEYKSHSSNKNYFMKRILCLLAITFFCNLTSLSQPVYDSSVHEPNIDSIKIYGYAMNCGLLVKDVKENRLSYALKYTIVPSKFYSRNADTSIHYLDFFKRDGGRLVKMSVPSDMYYCAIGYSVIHKNYYPIYNMIKFSFSSNPDSCRLFFAEKISEMKDFLCQKKINNPWLQKKLFSKAYQGAEFKH
jgi:hypothetical protein